MMNQIITFLQKNFSPISIARQCIILTQKPYFRFIFTQHILTKYNYKIFAKIPKKNDRTIIECSRYIFTNTKSGKLVCTGTYCRTTCPLTISFR